MKPWAYVCVVSVTITLGLFHSLCNAEVLGFEIDDVGLGDGRQPNRAFIGNGSDDQVPYGADSINDTAEYALGSYTHNIIFIQDDQLRNLDDRQHPKVSPDDCDTINCGVVHWSQSMLDSRKQRVEESASYWNEESSSRHHPAAQLDITIHFTNDTYNEGAAFTVDNIGDSSSSVGFVDALGKIDPSYAQYSSFSTATRHFNDDTRRAKNSHWAVTTFVKPYYGRASASINGAYTKGYEDDPTWTYLHELGHVFGALDEYGSHETDEISGYLYSYNTNAAYLPGGDEPNEDSISAVMKTHGVHEISNGTLDAIGWRDSDDDGIPDILDTNPTLIADTSGSQPSERVFQAHIETTVAPYVSPDPVEGDFTINTLASAQYRVNRELWTDLLPVDGTFGDYTAEFLIERAFAIEGTHYVDFRISNSVGNYTQQRFEFISFGAACDFGGGGCGLADINLMMAQGDLVAGVSASPSNQFNLNGDNVINEDDITEWLSLTGTTNGYRSPMLSGDTDNVGASSPTSRTVDITDFENFLAGFTGAGSTWEVGNFNGDSVVDITDFSFNFLSNFVATGGGTYDAGQLVPEPSAVQLLGLGGLLLAYLCCTKTTECGRRRPQHQRASFPLPSRQVARQQTAAVRVGKY